MPAIIENPFFVGGPVPPEKLVGRAREINAIFSAIWGRTHLAVYGSPGLGKSSILKYVAELQSWRARGLDPSAAVMVFLNCTDIYPFTPAVFWKAVLERVKKNSPAGASWLAAVEAGLLKPVVGRDDVRAVLERMLAANKSLALLLDDFDAALRENPQYLANDLEKFKIDLRALCNEYGTRCLSSIVTSFQRLPDLGPELLPSGSPWYNHYLFEPLKPFDRTEAASLFGRMPPGFALSQAQQDWIQELADGHPALLQNACHLLCSYFQNASKKEASEFAWELKEKTRHFFRDDWFFSRRAEQMGMLLIALLHLEGKVPGRDYKVDGLDTVLSQMSANLLGLIDRGVIERRPDGAKTVFRFRSSMMEWWVIQEIENCKDEAELAERQKVLVGLSTKQVERIKGVTRQIWQNKDAVISFAKWAGKIIGAFGGGVLGAAGQ